MIVTVSPALSIPCGVDSRGIPLGLQTKSGTNAFSNQQE